MWVEVLKSKDQALDCFKKIVKRAEVESDNKLKALRTNRGESSYPISSLFSVMSKGSRTTLLVVERRNQSVVEMARCMLKAMSVPARFWGEAVLTVVYVLNKSPTKSLQGVTPFEAWHKRKPRVSHLRTFGCVANVKQNGPGLNKLSDRSKKMIFIGYEAGTKGYRFYDPSTGRLVISRDVIFEENLAWNWGNTASSPTSSVEETETFIVHYKSTVPDPTMEGNVGDLPAEEEGEQFADQGGDVDPNEATPNPQNSPGSNQPAAGIFATPPSQHSEETFGGPLRFRTLNDLFDSTDEILDHEYSGVCMLAADEPIGVNEALEESCWLEAMEKELQSIQENDTWCYAVLPKGQKAIGLKWVYKVKRDPGVILSSTRQDLLQKVMLKGKGWIMKKYLLLLLG